MPDRPDTLMKPALEDLLEHVDAKFTLVTLAAKRAREINDYYNQLGEGLGKIVPPQVTSVSRKPLSISLEEIEAGKIVFVRIETDAETGTETEADAGAAAESETGAETEADAGAAAESETGAETEADAGAAVEGETGAETEADAGAAVEVEATADAEAEE